MPLVAELMRTLETAPVLKGRSCIMESGVLAFRREAGGATRVLLISKKRTRNWGIPKGRVSPHLSFAETAAEEGIRGSRGCGRYLTRLGRHVSRDEAHRRLVTPARYRGAGLSP
jgi:hypothetical protein